MTMHVIPLITEDHPRDYDGLPFLTLVRYHNIDYLTIVDNVTSGEMRLYIIDECGPNGIDIPELLGRVSNWHTHYNNIPLSVYMSMNGWTSEYSPLYKTLSIEFISRIIGPTPKFKLKPISPVKKRKRKPVTELSRYVIRDVIEIVEHLESELHLIVSERIDVQQ